MPSVDSETLKSITDNWSCLEDEACEATQVLSQLTDDAEQCRSSSEPSDDEPLVDGLPMKSTAPSWAIRIGQMTREHYLGMPRKPINVISGCTGISAESFVLQASFFMRKWKDFNLREWFITPPPPVLKVKLLIQYQYIDTHHPLLQMYVHPRRSWPLSHYLFYLGIDFSFRGGNGSSNNLGGSCSGNI